MNYTLYTLLQLKKVIDNTTGLYFPEYDIVTV